MYVTGYSFSTDFPIVNGFQTTNNNPTYGNVFVARLDTTQSGAASLLYSTYLGGGGNSTNSTQGYGDLGFGIAADANGFAYVTGVTTSDTSVTPFPTTPTAYQSSLASPNGNAFLTALDTNQSGSASLIYSTYLGGDGAGSLIGDIGESVAVDGFGDAYLAGQTTSDSSGPFPTTSSAYQSTLNSPNGNAFITEISTTQSGVQSLVYSTYFGGSTTSIVGDWGENIALDATGKVYITGGADSFDFPITSGAFQIANSDGGKAFAAKFDLTQSGSQSLVYSTFLGGTNGSTGENGNGIVVDSNGDAYVVGCTSSSDFPTTSGAFQSMLKSSGVNAYLSELNPGGTGLQYSTYLGGSGAFGDVATSVALDPLANPYLAGYTDSSDFPTSNAFQSSLSGGQSGFVAKFALNANPGITASPSPGPNSAGWNNSAVTVTFTCVPGAAPIQSCTAPVAVSTEGANQVVTGTAVDTANNTASASDTVNLDLTPPVLTISSPANNSTVATPYVIVSGTLTDSLSGPGSVICNSVPAALTGTNFSCTMQLSSVSNSIVVTGSDLAGNTASNTLTVTVSMPAPTSLTVSPANPNMIVGGAQPFTAVDQAGTTRPDATWTVSDTAIASFANGSSNTLVGNAAGTVTLTATVGSVTGQTTVTVLAGSSLAVGTVLWSAPPPSGYTTQQIVQAVPTANGPDLYAIDTDPNSDIVVQALKSDGTQLWQTTASASAYYTLVGLGDNTGGLLIEGEDSSSGNRNFTDLVPQTGNQAWQYTLPSYYDNLDQDVAVGLDGKVYVVETDAGNGGSFYGSQSYLDEFSPSGTLLSQIALPQSSFASVSPSCSNGSFTQTFAGGYGPPVVTPDGSVYLEVESSQETEVTNPPCNQSQISAYSEAVSLFHVAPAGGTQTQTLASYSLSDWYDPANNSAAPYHSPADVIPDGNGGVLASWTDFQNPTLSAYPPTIADISPQRTTQVTFPALNTEFCACDNNLVLGDSNIAFATDGTDVVSFNVATLQQNWTYASQAGNLTLVTATSGGGVTINDGQLGVIQLDSNGNPSTPIASTQGANPYEMLVPAYASLPSNLGLWATDTTGTLAFIIGPPEPVAPSPFVEPTGAEQRQRSAVPIPASIHYVLGNLTNLDGNAWSCGGQVQINLGNYGYAYCATATILDKDHNAIKNQPFRVWETIQPVAKNPQSLPINLFTTQGKGMYAHNDGTFNDSVAFWFPSQGPQPGWFFKAKQFLTVTNKLKSYNNLLILCHDYQWNFSTITDVTANPDASCQNY